MYFLDTVIRVRHSRQLAAGRVLEATNYDKVFEPVSEVKYQINRSLVIVALVLATVKESEK